MPQPVQVQDKQTGALVTIDSDDLGDAVRSGRYLVPEGTAVPVLDTDGSIKSLPVELIASGSAESIGVRVAGRGDITEWRKQQQFGEGVGNVVRATAEAGFNQAMAGFGDAALIKIGAATAEGITERRARNEVAATVGGAGGIILPLAATLGGSAGVQAGARGAIGLTGQALRLTPAALLARGGAAAQQAIAKQLGGGFLARASAAGVVGGLEGAVYGTGQATSTLAREGEDVLGDHESVAEYLLANAREGALLGAGAGIAGESLVSGLVAGGRKIKDTAQRFRRSEQLAEDASDGELRAAVREDAREQGVPAAEAERGLAKMLRERKAFRELPEAQAATITKLQALGDEAENLFDKAQGAMPLSGKFRSVKEAIRSSDDVADPLAVAAEGQQIVARLRKVLKEAATDPDTRQASVARSLLKFVDGTNKRTAKVLIGLQGKDGLKFAKEASAELGLDVTELAKLPRGKAVVDPQFRMFAELDQLKRAVGAHRVRLGGVADNDELGGTLAGKLVGAYGDLAEHLENAALYGRKAADIQIGDNRAWVPWFDTRRGYHRSFLADGMGGARTYDNFGTVPRFDPSKAGGVVRGILDPEASLRLEMLARNFDSSALLLEQLAKSHRAGASTQGLVKRYREVATKMIDELGALKQQSVDARSFDLLAKDFAGVPLVPAVAKAAIAVAERSKAITSIADVANKVETKVVAAVKGLTARLGTGKPGRAVVPALTGLDANETRQELYARKRQEVRDMMTDPTRIAGRAVGVADPNHAPTIAAHVATKASTAAEFLSSVAPVERTRHPLRPDLDKSPATDDIEARKWLRYVHAVQNPLAVLDAMAEGDVSREGVDAMRTVYPKLYERVINDVVDAVTSMTKLPSMTESVQLSVLFGVPLHFTMRPEFIASYQSSFQAQREAMANPAPPSARPTSPSRTAQGMATTTQRLER